MKKLFTLLFSIFILSVGYSQLPMIETVGTGTGNLTYAANPWVNTSVSYSGTGDTRSTSPSSGYTGASGERNVFLTNSASKTLIISNITIEDGATSGDLCFGILKSTTASNGSELTISYINATGPSSVVLPTGSGTAIWRKVCIPLSFTGGPITITFTNTGTSPQFRLDDIGLSGTILPVSLIDFNISTQSRSAKLSFTTELEANTSHFEIERATEANLFKGIGKVLAAGNSSEERSYTYTDEKPVKGNNYYRLKMIDNDGTYRYSEVVSAYFGNTNTGLVITPNLVQNILKISFEAPVENGRVLIYNLDGKLVQSYLLAEGIDVLRVDVSDLVSGHYVIQYQSNQGSETVRFVKE